MSVRIAIEEDVLQATLLANRFAHEAYDPWVDDETIYESVVDTINNPDKVILLYENKGFLAGVTHKFLLGNHLMAVELAWYVVPEARGEGVGKLLIESFEDWAKIMGCKLITMVSIDDEVGNYYKKLGYTLRERTYMKEI